MKIGYVNTLGGASGDMLIASLIDSGLNIEHLQSQLELLNVGGFDLSVVKDKRAGMSGTHLDVDLDGEGAKIRGISNFVDTVENSRISDDVKKTCIKIFDLIGQAEANVHGVPGKDVHLHELGTVDTLVDVGGGCGLDQVTGDSVAGFDPGVTPGPSGFITPESIIS